MWVRIPPGALIDKALTCALRFGLGIPRYPQALGEPNGCSRGQSRVTATRGIAAAVASAAARTTSRNTLVYVSAVIWMVL